MHQQTNSIVANPAGEQPTVEVPSSAEFTSNSTRSRRLVSHEIVVIGGTTVTVEVAHMRLCHSRMMFVRAYPRQTQEMVFDAHERAFGLFKGVCTRGTYDDMKTAIARQSG